MITVKKKKQLIKAIEDGEKNIKVDSLELYAACKLAESYDTVSGLLKHFAITNLYGIIGSVGTVNIIAGGTVVAITISVSVLITAIAIIGILKDRKVRIRVGGYGTEGEIEIV